MIEYFGFDISIFYIMKTNTKKNISMILAIVWIANCFLAIMIAITTIWLPSMQAKTYTNIKADPFDGTVMPISYVPNWLKADLRNKALDFRNISSSDLVPIPKYDVSALLDQNNIMGRFTYPVMYMGSYTLNYKEYDGSHLGIDMRAPIGTPVLSIANGVVVRTVEADASGNKFVVIRHEGVNIGGKKQDIFSSYLHLSEITTTEGTKIKKGDMLGRVGQTGLATTPHLHFQIDTQDAPFHPYWPYTSAEARDKGLSFLQAVTAGLGADKAQKYTINPLEFVQNYLSGNPEKSAPTTQKVDIPLKTLDEIVDYIVPEVESAPSTLLDQIVSYTPANEEKVIVASQTTYNSALCSNLSNISGSENFLKNVFKISGNACIFDNIEKINENSLLTRADALMILMKFYGENPSDSISPFDDIAIGNTKLQGYAARAYEKGILRGENFFPNKNLTRGEFVEILGRFRKLTDANGKISYTDVPNTSSLFKNIQNYGATIGTKYKNFGPNTLISQREAAEILVKLMK